MADGYCELTCGICSSCDWEEVAEWEWPSHGSGDPDTCGDGDTSFSCGTGLSA